jgi:hypothetical protein
LFCFLTITTANVDAGTGGHPTIVGSHYKIGCGRIFAVGHESNVKMFDLDEDNKAKANVVPPAIIVSFARGTLHGRLIKEGNV